MMPMAGEAYSIVNKSLETGGRGSTTQSTDYSALSDAMMKKAALHTQIAGMQMDFTSQKVSTLSNLELAKADIHMKGAELAQRESHFNREMKAREDADKMSPFEQITGVLAGAASGAIAGQTVAPGPAGLIGGAVIGGGLAATSGNSRTRQQNMLGNINTISSAAVALKGMSNTKKAQDSTTEMMKGVSSVAGIFRTSAPGSEEFQGAERQLDNYISQYGQSQIQAGRPMGEVHKEMASIKKEAMSGFDPNDSEMVANRKIAARVAEAKTDEAFMRGDRKAVQQFQADTAAYHIEGYGKAPTNAMMKVWTGQADMGVAENFYKGVNAMPTSSAAPAGKTSTNMGATTTTQNAGGNTASGMESPSTGRSTAEANAISSQRADNGLLVPNAIVPGAGVGVMAPQAATAGTMWGVDLDNGPEQMLADASSDFNAAAAKDPTLIDKALNKEEPSFGDRLMQSAKTTAFGGDDQLKQLMNPIDSAKEGFKSAKDKVMSTKAGQMAFGTGPQAAPAPMQKQESNAPVTKSLAANKSAVIQPNIISTDPVQAKKEQVFKTATDSSTLIKEFELQGRYPDKATTDAVMAPVMATTEMNRLRNYINEPQVQEALREMTPEQRRLWDNYVRGLGEQAMKGDSKGVAGSALGASAQVNWSNFERSINIENEGKGEHGGLSKKGLTALNRIKTKMTPAARTIGMAFNSGTLTNQDVSWVPESMVNMFDQDPETATAGFSDLQDSVWNMFTLRHGSYMSGEDLNAHKARGRKPTAPRNTANDEFQLVP